MNPTDTDESNKRQGNLRLMLGSLLVSALLCLIWLLRIPADSASALLFGFSLSRLAMALPLLLTMLGCTTWVVQTRRHPDLAVKALAWLTKPSTRFAIPAVAALVFLAAWHMLIFLHLLNQNFNPFLKTRLLPFTMWLLFSGLILLAGMPSLRLYERQHKFSFRSLRLPFVISMTILLAYWLLAITISLGVTTFSTTISDLGVPLLEWQIIFVAGLLLTLSLLAFNIADHPWIQSLVKSKASVYLDLACCFMLWLLAVLLWTRLPIPDNNYFAPAPLPPAYENYPFSDAQRYSLDALQFLYGDTRQEIISKPLFVLYLAGLHSLGGFSYERLVFLQTLMLALFPVVLYLIGRKLGGGLLGLGMGFFAIFREMNFIQASNIANVSNSKLLMTDFPYTLGIALLAWLTLLWLEDRRDERTALLLTGGTLALNCLLRPQTLILIPFYLLLILIKHRRAWKKALSAALLLMFILALTILPLLLRNYHVAGVFWFDDPGYMSNFVSNYALSDVEGAVEGAEQAVNGGFLTELLAGLRSGDASLLTGILGNFFRNFLSAFLQFPIRVDFSQSLTSLSILNENFWGEANAYLQPIHHVWALLNALILALGLAMLWVRHKIQILALLGLFVLINLSSALFRFSGWRFIMPVDWIFYAFYLTGLGAWMRVVMKRNPGLALPPAQVDANAAGLQSPPRKFGFSHALICLGFLILGALIPLREAFQRPFQTPSRQQLCEQIIEVSKEDSGLAVEDVARFCLAEDTIVRSGRVLYPRFFRGGYGYVDRPNVFYGTLDYARLSFYLLNENTSRYYLPLKGDGEGLPLANGSQVILISRQDLLPEIQLLAVFGAPDSLTRGALLFSSRLDFGEKPR